MEVTYYAPNHHAVSLPDGTIKRPVNGAFVADIAFRDTLETAGIFVAPGSIDGIGQWFDLTTANNGQTVTNDLTKDIYTVPSGLPAGFTCTVVQGYSVPTGFEAGAGVTLNGAKLLTSKQGEGLRLEYVSTDVYNVVPV